MSTSAVSSNVLENQCGSFSLNPWYLLRTKPCQEDRAKHFLSLLGADVLLPMYVTDKSPEARPFFPGYIFSRFPIELFTRVNSVFGVRKIVRFGAIPAYVPEQVIEDLQDAMVAGNIKLAHSRARFEHGDQVAVTAGAFKGWYGVFDKELSGRDRVKVLLNTVSGSAGFHQQTHGLALSIEVRKFDLMLA